MKKEGQYRINEKTGRILRYSPDKKARALMDELNKELAHLDHLRASWDIIPEETRQEGTVPRRSKLFVRDITVKQSEEGNSSDEQLADELTHTRKLSKRTDNIIKKRIKDTSNDADLVATETAKSA